MKGIIKSLIRRPVTCLMLVTSFSMLGLVSLNRIPVGLLPNVASPGITIITRYPGVSADSVEKILTIPIERAVSDIAGIEEILSSSGDGESRIHLLFSHEADIDMRILDASEKIYAIRGRFPREVEDPSIVRYDPSDRPVYIVSFSGSSYDLKTLRELVEQKIKLRYERIQGVSEVFVGGGYEREIHVVFDPSRLAISGTGSDALGRAVADGNLFLPGGKIHRGNGESLIYTDAKMRTLSQFDSMYVPAALEEKHRRREIPLHSISRIEDTFREQTSISRTNGEDRVSIYIEKAGNANTLSITEACEKVTAGLSEFPHLVSHVSYNQGGEIREAIDQVVWQCITGALIAVAVLYLFLRRLGSTLVISIAIPASILTTFFLMFLSGLEMNVMSLSGLALGGGMLIDNAIVVTEAVDVATGSGRRTGIAGYIQQVQEAATAVSGEVVAATLANVIVFLPLAFSDYETRAMYQGFALTVTYSLLISMVFSLTVLPAFLIPASNIDREGKMLGQALTFFLDRLPAPLAAKANERMGRLLPILRERKRQASNQIRHRYGQTLEWAAGSFVHTRRILLIFSVMLILLPVLFIFSKKEYMSPTGSDTIEASVDLDAGIHLAQTEDVVGRIENQIRGNPAVAEVNAKIETSHASLTIKLKPPGERELNREETIAALRQLTDGNSAAFVHYEIAGEEVSSREIELDFSGDDVKAMKQFARDASGRLQSEIPEIDQVILRFRDGKQDLVILPHRTKIDLMHSSIREVGSSLRQMLQGTIVTKYYDHDREVDVRLKADSGRIETPQDVMNLVLPVAGGSVPLNTQAAFTFEESETKIWHKNKRRTVSLLIKFRSGDMESISNRIEEVLSGMTLPPETTFAFGNAYRKMKENQRQMIYVVLMSIALIYLLLGYEFESFYQPLLLMTVIPLSAFFALSILSLIGQPLNISVYIGLIMLGGIVVNNAIIVLGELAHALPELRKDPTPHAYLSAGLSRLRPIVMTLLATIVDMLPMVVDFSDQSGLWRPLAVTAVAGLIFSIPAMAYFIPFATWWLDTRIILPRQGLFITETASN